MKHVWIEYDQVAEQMARNGFKGVIGDPLPNLISSQCVDLISKDPEAFEKRVRECAYAIAMEKVGIK